MAAMSPFPSRPLAVVHGVGGADWWRFPEMLTRVLAMDYYWIVPQDQRHNNWILHEEIEDEQGIITITVRERYRHLSCRTCGKFDEIAALTSGLDEQIRILARADFVASNDGVLCISERLAKMLPDHGVSGLRYLPLPNDGDYLVTLPEHECEASPEDSGMEFLNPCLECGRFEETCGFPSVAHMTLPADEMSVVCPNISLETGFGRDFWFLVSEPIRDLLLDNKTTGIDRFFGPAY